MSVSSNYYLDSASLATATRVFTDVDLTICAPDGYYSDGVIVRQQVSCILGDISACPSCSMPCGKALNINLVQGYCTMSYDVGTNTGAIVFAINPLNSHLGVLIEYDGVYYSNFVSTANGYLPGIGDSTYIGYSPTACFTPPSSFTLDTYVIIDEVIYNQFTTTGINIVSAQCQFTSTLSDWHYIVIPKTNMSPSKVNIYLTNPCTPENISLNIHCPAELDVVLACETPYDNPVSPCGCINFINYYVKFVNGNNTQLGLYDMIFTDANGQNPAIDGFYKCSLVPPGNDWFEIQNGIIVSFGNC